jgi:hypothetical protein
MNSCARLYNRYRCHAQVQICSHCDRGNIYCNDCAPIAREDAQRRAAKRYQSSLQGRTKHTARQRRYRERQQQKVTHKGSFRITLHDLLKTRSVISDTGGEATIK